MEISIKLFGKAKELEPKGLVKVTIERTISVAELRGVLAEILSTRQDPETVKELIADCALGNQERILRDQDLVSENQGLVLLPPVCGG